MDWMQVVISVTGLLGHALVANKNPWGYASWIVGNIFTIIVSVQHQLLTLAALFLVYTIIAIRAMRRWRREARVKETSCPPGCICQRPASR